MTRTALALAAAAFLAGACGTSSPAHVEKKHGLGGSSLVYIEPFDFSKTQRVGKNTPETPQELAARVRAHLITRLRETGLQTRDADGSVPSDGVLVRGVVDTIDGGPSEGTSIGKERLHCSVELWNGRVNDDEPAFALKTSGCPSIPFSPGMLGAADDVADQIAKFIRENP